MEMEGMNGTPRGYPASLLTGKLWCGWVDGQEHPMHRCQEVANSAWYRCAIRETTDGGACSMPDVPAARIERAVVDRLFSDVLTSENLQPLLPALRAAFVQSLSPEGISSAFPINSVEGVRERLQSVLLGEDIHLARLLLDYFVAKVVVAGDSGTIYYTFPLNDPLTVGHTEVTL